jgi:aldehyde:ferredoxin oxidoreductase
MKALLVDLSKSTFKWARIQEESIGYYLGGRGLGARYLYDNLAPHTDAYSPDNILSFWNSPLIGTHAMSVVKLCGVTKSPTTGTILMSLMGGFAGAEMRAAGADALIITGKAQKPVYLLIKNGKASLHDASHLWGKFTSETDQILKKELKLKKVRILTIGPAGENRNACASILDGGNAMGRGGIGAVMGSKNLKAIAVSGERHPEIHDQERFTRYVKEITKRYLESQQIQLYGTMGTPSHVDGVNLARYFPTRNYQTNFFENFEKVNGSTLYERFVKNRATCFGCVVRCRRVCEINEGRYKGVRTEGPEYESLWALSGNCGNDSLEAVIAANSLCAEYGMDTISTGSAISFAMECHG